MGAPRTPISDRRVRSASERMWTIRLRELCRFQPRHQHPSRLRIRDFCLQEISVMMNSQSLNLPRWRKNPRKHQPRLQLFARLQIHPPLPPMHYCFFWLGPWPVPSYLPPPPPPSTGVFPGARPETAISEPQNNSNFQSNAHTIPASGRVQVSWVR